MALPNIILNNFATADGVTLANTNVLWFDKALVDQVQANGGGAAELVQDKIGRIRVNDIFHAGVTTNGDKLIERVLNMNDTYSTPNTFIDAEIARLQARIAELEALRQ